jgi:HD-like signal output (HDOD) protein
MSLFSWLWDQLVGSRGPAEPAAGAGARTGTTTAVAERPASRSDSEGDDWWLPRDSASASNRDGDGDGRVHGQLYSRLTQVLDDPNLELPRLPRVTDRALTMLRGNETNYHELSELIEQDPALTAEVLRVANSVAYRGVSEIRRLEVAFARLGQRALRSVLLGATVRSISISLGGAHRSLGEEIWRRCVAAGAISALMAGRHRVDPKDALLAGLLHDIGEFVVLTVAHDYQRRTGARVPRAAFDRLAAEWHEHVGLRLATAWNLPDPLPALISSHHKLPAPGDPLETERLLILFSDLVCSLLNYSPYQPVDFFAAPCVVRLGLQDDERTREFLRSLPARIDGRLDPI